MSPIGEARSAPPGRRARAKSWGKVVPQPSRSPSPGLSSADAACSWTQRASERVHGAARNATTAAVAPTGRAHAGSCGAKALEVTKLSRPGSNQMVASG